MAKGNPPNSNVPDDGLERSYEVGRGKPPLEHQWKPGQSGNKKGRKKGSKNRKTVILAALRKTHPATKGGRRKKLTLDEIGVLNIERDVKGGDRGAFLQWLAISEPYVDRTDTGVSMKDLLAEDQLILANLLARRARNPK
ncbi:MAG: DUF5681 domain-containing protein [Pseudolabrys sp.]|nr:DUF5681 domain-containing protein [Pseudolabrys sp.]